MSALCGVLASELSPLPPRAGAAAHPDTRGTGALAHSLGCSALWGTAAGPGPSTLLADASGADCLPASTQQHVRPSVNIYCSSRRATRFQQNGIISTEPTSCIWYILKRKGTEVTLHAVGSCKGCCARGRFHCC